MGRAHLAVFQGKVQEGFQDARHGARDALLALVEAVLLPCFVASLSRRAAKRPFPAVGLNVAEGWICDDPLWDGETKKRTFVVWPALADSRMAVLDQRTLIHGVNAAGNKRGP
jgi:hypothetical protein